MNEKRKYKRKLIEIDVEYDVSANQVWLESKTRDIGTGGLCLITSTPLEVDKDILVKILLPERKKPIFVNARTVWNKSFAEKGKEMYYNGVKFTDLRDDDLEFVRKYVEDITFDAN